MVRTTSWIDVYPINESGLVRYNKLEIVNSGARVQLSKELSDYCTEQWTPKAAKGWKSSWLAFAENLKYSSDGEQTYVTIKLGAMPFFICDGIVKSIEEQKDFAPKQGYANSVSIGFPTATKDGKIMLQRRAPDVHCPNILIHEPCGYMASMNFAPRAECDLGKYAEDSRLFDLVGQLDYRKEEIAKTFSIPSELVSYELRQDFLAAGWITKEMYFSTTGRIDVNSIELKIPENQEIFFVPFEHLKDLIYNQGKLSQINANGYRPLDAREIPLIDETLIGLVWGYEKLTGEKLDVEDTIARLNHDGMNIKVYPASSDGLSNEYQFPTRF
ncbi:Uncharacterised protein [uncultured archaeon]|nr:Uncharacterised protein [uncultured archaeon]